METKSYTGTNYRDIMNRIKQENGDDVVIVDSGRRSHPAGPQHGWSYEVVVGSTAKEAHPSTPALSTAGGKQAAPAVLQQEVQQLAHSLQQLQERMDLPVEQAVSPVLIALSHNLGQVEVKRDVINNLLQDLQLSATPRELRSKKLIRERAMRWITRRLRAAGIPSAVEGTALKLAFIGPTGAGKTASLIKLAANRTFFGGRRIGILSLDTRKIAASKQLQVFADIVKAELKLAYQAGDIKPALRELQHCDVILIDTPGASWRSGRQLRDVEQMLEQVAPQETHLVLPLNTKYSDLERMVSEYRQVSFNRILLTKLDETGTLGNVLNLACDIKPVFSFLGSGQRIPEDIISMRPSRMADRLLAGEGFPIVEV